MPDYGEFFVGLNTLVPLLDGSKRIYTNLDNAASTPSFLAVKESVDAFLDYYSSVHRGTGFKSQVSTHAYEMAREAVMDFTGADRQHDVCVFGKNTTEAINKLARRFPFTARRNVVLVSQMEHHSNDLPWRAAAHAVHIGLTPEGRLDEANFDELLKKYTERVALVAITGGSNVSGYINPVYRLAEKAHAAGAQILVDCAQLAPHRKVDMLSSDDPRHLDYVTISAHKLYAPFGSGALVGPRETFERGDPEYRGGGQVDIVTLDSVVWSSSPERDEAGSPNTVGAVALAAAIHQMQAIGMDRVAEHEAELTAYALPRLQAVRGVQVYGDLDPSCAASRLGVIPLSMQGVPHFLLSAILSYEFGIGVRNGCFCAHPYLLHLLGVGEEKAGQIRQDILKHDRREVPGLVRVSFGLYNRFDEVDRLVEALERICRGEYSGSYIQDAASGDYSPRGWEVDFADYFSVSRFVRQTDAALQ
ncbi:MAG: aminotransferase class V-fold PLP-dependent enzyme [Anaerolineaceae bacterium]|nr:aminotransferase class V-fold PLP-dependent enzyme [Anaerolineaceae bacterium]